MPSLKMHRSGLGVAFWFLSTRALSMHCSDLDHSGYQMQPLCWCEIEGCPNLSTRPTPLRVPYLTRRRRWIRLDVICIQGSTDSDEGEAKLGVFVEGLAANELDTIPFLPQRRGQEIACGIKIRRY